MSILPPFTLTSRNWLGWSHVTPNNSAKYFTNLSPAVAGNIFDVPQTNTQGPRYLYLCALALVNKNGQVCVSFLDFVEPEPPQTGPQIPELPFSSWTKWVSRTTLPLAEFKNAEVALKNVALYAQGQTLCLYAVGVDGRAYYTSTSYGQTTSSGQQKWNPWNQVSGGAGPTSNALSGLPRSRRALPGE